MSSDNLAKEEYKLNLVIQVLPKAWSLTGTTACQAIMAIAKIMDTPFFLHQSFKF